MSTPRPHTVDEKVLPLTATFVGDVSEYVVKPLIVTDSIARLPSNWSRSRIVKWKAGSVTGVPLDVSKLNSRSTDVSESTWI